MDNQGNNYTEEQKAIIAHRDGPAYVVAGAGTGKTFTMTARVQALIESGVAPEHILVLTFTNAAAREMVQRVHKAVGNTARKVTACTYHSLCNILKMCIRDSCYVDPAFTTARYGKRTIWFK